MAHRLFNSNHPLTTAVYTALAAHDVGCAWRFVKLYEQSEPRSSDMRDHLHAMNQFWRDQLCDVPVDTIRVRSNLIDQIDLEDWLRLFAQEVAPVIVAFDLPGELRRCDETFGGGLFQPTYNLANAL